MVNELLWLLFLVLDLTLIVLIFRLFGKTGLYMMIVLNIIIANIQVLKTVEMFGFVFTLGNILYGALFLATDLLSEVYGKDVAKKGVWLGFFAMVLSTLFLQLSLLFVPHASDFANEHLVALFSLLPRIALGSLVAYFVSQNHDIWAFHVWKARFNDRHLWLRNNLSTLVSQFIDSAIFCTIAFLGVWEMDIFWQILLTTYVIKFVVAIIDTPFVYWGRYVASKKQSDSVQFIQLR